MKRLLCILLLLSFLMPMLFSCRKDDTEIRVGVLSGPTALGMLALMEEENPQYLFEAPYTSPDLILGDITSGKLDIAALPTNNAAMLYNRGTDIKVIALNTLGVLHLLDSTGTVTELDDLAGKTVYVPNAGSNPEYVVRHLLREKGISANVDISIVQPAALQTAFLSGSAPIVVLPQPAATATAKNAEAQGKTVTSLDLSLAWSEISDTPMVQGCLVANATFLEKHPRAVEAFLDEYEASVAYMTAPENLDAAANLAVAHGIIPKPQLAKLAIPKCAITYVDGREMKDALSAFYDVLGSHSLASIGGKLPDDDFYYHGK